MLPEHHTRLSSAHAFIFDFHGTLAGFDHAPRPLWQLLNDMGHRSSHHLQTIWDSDAFDGALTPGAATNPNYDSWRRGNLKQFARLSGVPESMLDQIVGELLQHLQQATFKPLPGAVPLVRLLKEKGRKLGVCSNWDAPLREVLARANFPDFDAITISWQVGARKPNAAIFHDVCEKLGVMSSSAVYIGDSWTADVVGALRVGLLPVWLHHDAPANPLPHHVIAFETLQQFESAMKQLI